MAHRYPARRREKNERLTHRSGDLRGSHFSDKQRDEVREKMALYFDAGASEVWLCDEDGTLRFFSEPEQQLKTSILIPGFPDSV